MDPQDDQVIVTQGKAAVELDRDFLALEVVQVSGSSAPPPR
jgi:hypothetical protein